MVDAAISAPRQAARTQSRSSLRRTMQRKSTIAFFMALPLILLIAILVLHPAGAMDGWLHRGPAPTAEEDCTPALVKLAHSESLCPAMRNLLVEVYRGLTPVPGRFRSLLEERLTALLADWSLQAMASGRLRRAMTRLLAELYECSESGLVELVLQAARERNPEPELQPLHDLALDALTGQTLPE